MYVYISDSKIQLIFVNMAAACLLPDSLYNLSVSATVLIYNIHRTDIHTLPESVQFDVYFKVSDESTSVWSGCATAMLRHLSINRYNNNVLVK